MHLDRGMLHSTLMVDGVTIENPLNQEVAAIRGMLPGEYVVNLYYYESDTRDAVAVSVKVARVNPVYTVAYYVTTVLAEKGEEQTALRFSIDRNGAITGVNKLPKSLVP